MAGVHGDQECPMLPPPPQVGVVCHHHCDIECLMPGLSPAAAVNRESSDSRLNANLGFKSLFFSVVFPFRLLAIYLSNCFSLHDAYRPLLPIPRLVRVSKVYGNERVYVKGACGSVDSTSILGLCILCLFVFHTTCIP